MISDGFMVLTPPISRRATVILQSLSVAVLFTMTEASQTMMEEAPSQPSVASRDNLTENVKPCQNRKKVDPNVTLTAMNGQIYSISKDGRINPLKENGKRLLEEGDEVTSSAEEYDDAPDETGGKAHADGAKKSADGVKPKTKRRPYVKKPKNQKPFIINA